MSELKIMALLGNIVVCVVIAAYIEIVLCCMFGFSGARWHAIGIAGVMAAGSLDAVLVRTAPRRR